MSSGRTLARKEILARLHRVLEEPSGLFRGPGDVRKPVVAMTVTHAEGDRHALARLFAAKLAALGGSCEITKQPSEVPERVLEKIRAWKSNGVDVGEILSWASGELSIPDIEERLERAGLSLFVPDDLHDGHVRSRASSAVVGLTSADAAFAATGSVVLMSASGKSRAASLLPLHHLVLVPTSRLYPTIEAWLQELRQGDRLGELLRANAQIAFVTGPSKSADIELNLTLGVHGPRVVHAIIFDDNP